jgi:thioredoxin reductase (NADPH)
VENTSVSNDFDVLVVGAGIAGLTAGLMSARAGRRTRVLTGPSLGGHLLSIERIDGYPGSPDGIPGYDLCPMVQEQATAAGAEFSAGAATALAAHDGHWSVTTSEGDLRTKTVVIATGTTSRTLGIPGEDRLAGKGVSHCASCDGPLLRTRVVGVVGGGDSALQEALTLARFAARVIVMHRGTSLSAQAAYRAQAARQQVIEVRLSTVVEEVLGDAVLTGVRTRSVRDAAVTDVELAGLFVYVGLKPDTDWLSGTVALDASGRVLTDASMRCGAPGLFAAGTVRSGSAGRAAAAAGDGATAAVAADRYLHDGAWPA